MATNNPKVSGYVQRPVYDKLIAFKDDRGYASISQALTAVREEYFGIASDKDAFSRLEILEKKVASLSEQVAKLTRADAPRATTGEPLQTDGEICKAIALPNFTGDTQAMEERWQEVERQRYEYLKSLSLTELANYLNLHYRESVRAERERIFQKIQPDQFRETQANRTEYLTKEGLMTLRQLANCLHLHFKEAELAERKGFFNEIAVSAKTFPRNCLYSGGFTDYGNCDVRKLNDLTYYKPPFQLTPEQKSFRAGKRNLNPFTSLRKVGNYPV